MIREWNELKRYFAVLFIFVGSVLITLTGFILLRPALLREKEYRLPASIAGLPLSGSSGGEQAVSALAQMHGMQFPLADAWIGNYGSRRQVTLWVAVSPDTASSARLLAAMREKIALDNTPFTPVGERKEGKRSIYELNGMGQEHFYFQSGKLLVWLAADDDIAPRAIQETLKYYP